MAETKLRITGLDCMDCARGLEASVAKLPGVEEVSLQFFDGVMRVIGDVKDKDLHKMITTMGYGVADADQDGQNPADQPNAVLGFWRYLLAQVESKLALIAGVVVLLSLALGWIGAPEWAVISLQIGALIMAGWPIARSGLVNLWVNHTFNINFLMTMAGIGAVVIGEYAEAASLILLFDLAEALEGFTNERARGTISRLTSLTPTHAVKLEDGVESLVPVEMLVIGDRFIVRPGERLPLDGVIVEGESDLNQAPITGESLPVWKNVGDEVFSGTVNGSGRLIVEVSRLVADSTLHRIIEMVTEAQSRQSRSQKFIEKFAKYYTPAMVVLAIFDGISPPALLWRAIPEHGRWDTRLVAPVAGAVGDQLPLCIGDFNACDNGRQPDPRGQGRSFI